MTREKNVLKLKEKTPKLFAYFLLLLATVFIMYIVLPMLNFLKDITVILNWNLYQILNVCFPMIILLFIFEISRQLTPILDMFVSQFIYTLPGLKKIEKISIRRILSDFTYVIIAILILTTLSPLAYKLSHLGGIVINVTFLVVILILIYDAGKTSYVLFERRIQNFNSKKEKSKQ